MAHTSGPAWLALSPGVDGVPGGRGMGGHEAGGGGGRLGGCLVLLLSLEYGHELVVVELALLQGSLLPCLLDLVRAEVVTHVLEQILEVLLGEESLALLVKHREGVPDGVLGVGTAELLAEEVEEHGEVEGAGGFLEHLLQLIIGGDAAKVGVHVLEILDVDHTVTVLVDHGEGLFELLHLPYETGQTHWRL